MCIVYRPQCGRFVAGLWKGEQVIALQALAHGRLHNEALVLCPMILQDQELEHAKARGAKIYAELTGYGANSDGFSAAVGVRLL